jgi:sporulation protein YlmC with PRC-barrel domain
VKNLFQIASIVTALGLGMTVVHGQESSSESGDQSPPTQESSSQPQSSSSSSDSTTPQQSGQSSLQQQRTDSSDTTSRPRKVSEADMKKKVTKINKASSFIGMTVKNLQNDNLGKIEDLAFDNESGQIAYAVLAIGGFLGLNEKYIAVPLQSLTAAPGEDHLVLDADKQRLQNAPGFAKNRWPDLTTPAWGAASGFATKRPESASPGSSATGTIGQSGSQRGSATEESSRSSATQVESDRSTQPDSSPRSTAYKSQSSQQYSGTLSAVDQDTRSLTVKGDAGERKFTLDSTAQIRSDGENDRKLDDLKVGSQVTVEYASEAGKAVAKVIQAKDSSSDQEKDDSSSSSSSSSDEK